ncbi:MAG: HAD-IA family hydrolase [Gammaproteobacteria bacterium]|nr:HAD-IA family hydrolase [Gammaproteobacteria bacterium]
MTFPKIKTVLFDLDGTLLDTAPDLAYALNKLLEQEGLSPVSYEKVREVASDGSRALLALGMQVNEEHPQFDNFKNIFLKYYQQHISVSTTLFPGMDIVLNHLDEQGIAWGVVTNKPSQLTQVLMSDLELTDRCACIIGADAALRPKPHPDSLLLACEKTQSLPSECVYIGDAERDIEAAKYAGMRSIAALYGYLRNDCSPEYWHADYYIDHPKDIVCWLNKQLSFAECN